MSYFKNSSNIPSAITIWWSTGQQTGVWWSTGQQAGDIRPVTRRPGNTICHPASRFPQFGASLKINEISMNVQYTKRSSEWCLKTSKSVQNEVPRGTWSHQNNEKVEKVKSHENISIYYTFERLDHQKSQDFPIKINQNSCMQSKQAFVQFESQKIWKSDPKWSPEGDPKSTKNHEKSILGPSRAPLCASLLNLITKMVPKDLQTHQKLPSGDLNMKWKINNIQ